MSHLELVKDLLQAQSTLALATTSGDGAPRIAPVFYLCYDDLLLCWLSGASSEHSRNLARNPLAAVTVYAHTEDWTGIRGVQARGAVSAITNGARRKQMVAAYVERFRLGAMFQTAISASRLYAFEPSWLRYLDNSRGFGYSFELSIAVSAGR